jgi:hypothetical protein
MTGEVIRASRASTYRYEKAVQASWCNGRQEARQDPRRRGLAHGQTVINHQSRASKTRLGYDFVHSLVDNCSRPAYSEILPDEKGATCAVFLPELPPTSPPTASPASSG